MRIFFFTKYSRKGASSRYRSHQFLEFYRGVGVKTRCFPLFPDEYLEDLYAGVKSTTPISDLYWKRSRDMRWLGDCDLAVVEKEFFPYLPALFEKKAFERAKHVLLDFDDAIFFKYQYHPSFLVRRLVGKKIERLMSWSDGVIGGNRFLSDYASRHAPRTWMVPTSINTDKYLQHDHDHEGLVTIGWIGTPVTAKYLEVIRGPIEKVAREVPIRFLVIGAPAPAWDRVETQSHEWSEEKESEWIRWMDIGLMPLEDTPWEKGKCGLKILQYMAAQVVPVVSNVGAIGEIVTDGKEGFLCATEDEWVDRLLELARNPAKRIEMGRAAREKAVSQYSVSVAAGRLLQIFREVVGDHSLGGRPVAASAFQPNES
jgi:glycosyltransferase involved in cell wall biosynthesis